MKDLKHLYFFEKLLDDANNELVRAAKDEGRVCVGSVCSLVPKSVRVRNLYGASACTANRLDGDGNLLSDEFPVRVQQSTAGAGQLRVDISFWIV